MRYWNRWCSAVTLLGFAAPLAAQGSGGAAMPATPVTSDMLLNAQQSGDWLMYGGNYWNNRHSPLNTINTTNVKNLVPRWVFQTGSEQNASLETTPVVVNGIIYFTSAVAPNNLVFAYDLKTGKPVWQKELKVASNAFGVACCGRNNRGVAVANGMVYVATLDAHLVALDQATGDVKWDVVVGDPAQGYTETMAPLALDGNVIIGTSGAE